MAKTFFVQVLQFLQQIVDDPSGLFAELRRAVLAQKHPFLAASSEELGAADRPMLRATPRPTRSFTARGDGPPDSDDG